MTSEEILYDHYKDTFEQQKKYLRRRDGLTVLLFVVVGLMLLYGYIPGTLQSALGGYIEKQLESPLLVDFTYVQSVFLAFFLWVWVQYCQIVMTVENTYTYIHRLEEKLTDQKCEISREGKSYLNPYPALKWAVDKFYCWVLPALIVLASILKFVNELHSGEPHIWFDGIILLLVVIVALFFFSFRALHEDALGEDYKEVCCLKRLWWYIAGIPSNQRK